MSLDPPAYIVSLQNNIRARPVSWEGAVRAKTITDDHLKQIRAVDKVRKEQRRSTIEGDVSQFVKLFFGGDGAQSIFQVASKREDIVQYLLVLVHDIIDDPYKPLLPFLKQSSNSEDPIPLLTSTVLSALVSRHLNPAAKAPPQVEETLPKLYEYLSALAGSTDSGVQDIAVQQYSATLKNQRARQLFWEQRSKTLDPLIEILRAAAGSATESTNSETTLGNGRSSIRSIGGSEGLAGGVGIQLTYNVLLVVWQLSFEAELVGQGLDADHDIVTLYTALIRVSPKEKLTRLLLATLANLFNPLENRSFLLPAATQSKLPGLLGNLASRHLADDDLQQDLKSLKQQLDDYAATQTTLDSYVDEVKGGHLRWSPPHKNAQFWRDNAAAIAADKALLGKLAEILGKPWDADKQVLAIACSDVASLVREHGEARRALDKLGVKARVMALMGSDDAGVRWEALRAVGEWMRYSGGG